MTTVVVNLGGEGEPVEGDLVVNVNLMQARLLVRSGFARNLPPNQVVVRASAGQLPFPRAIADRVVAHHFPIQSGQLAGGGTIEDLSEDVARVVRGGGSIDFHCSSCDVRQLTAAFEVAGLELIQAARPGYPLHLRKRRMQ